MSNIGAKAALKGYRLQAFYILDLLLHIENHQLIFQPEGHEDLAIYQNDNLIQCIQVKNRAENLTISDFSPDKKDSFFHRAVKLLKESPRVIIKVISYGNIGPEIINAWSGNKSSQEVIINKLRSISNPFKIEDINLLFDNIIWEKVSENEVLQRINKQLSHSLTSGSPEHAFSLLIWWLYIASESRAKITHEELLSKIILVGKYLNERISYQKEWFHSLFPLISQENLDLDSLSQEYYQGVSTRFSHIQLGLDIYRKNQLDKIDELLIKNKIIIIHGASGQGKTSLAYRYLLEFVPEEWRLQVDYINGKEHAKCIALAIADYLAIFKATLYIYIDVSPKDTDWNILIKALLDISNIKIIVTIRSEDLARDTIGLEELGLPALLQVNLYQEEAEYIYTQLSNKKIVKKSFPTAKQAWITFGSNGSLLEYIYFLTQTTSLKEKLHSQIKRLQEEIRQGKLPSQATKLLLSCAIATSYEARIDIALVAKKLSFIEVQETFSFFEDEYLLRKSIDKRYVEALHPIRSRILSELLIDPAFSPWIESVGLLIPCLVEEDLGSFLLYAFTEYSQSFESIFNQLINVQFKTWQGIAGVCNALIWYGIYEHIKQNRQVIIETQELVGREAANLILCEDVSGMLSENPIEQLILNAPKTNPEFIEYYKILKSKLTSRESIFRNIKNWLSNISQFPCKPTQINEWDNFCDVLFWCAHLNITEKMDDTWFLDIDIDQEIHSITTLASFTFSLYHYNKSMYNTFIMKNDEKVKKVFQYSTNTFWLEILPTNPIAHYAIPLSETGNFQKNYLNDLTCHNAELLRKIYPDQELYGAKGYGHIAPYFLEQYRDKLIDEAEKKGILKIAFPISQLVNINVIWNNYNNYICRPDDWISYIEIVFSQREEIIKGLNKLINALVSHFRKNRPRVLLGSKINEEYWNTLTDFRKENPLLPKLAVDRWGFSSETTSKNSEQQKLSKHYITIQDEYKEYLSSLQKYTSDVSRFFDKSKLALLINSYISRVDPKLRPYYIQLSKTIGYDNLEADIRISIFSLFDAYNNLSTMQYHFRNHFRPMIDIKRLTKLEKKECNIFTNIIPIWYQYCFYAEKLLKRDPLSLSISIYHEAENNLLKKISYILKHQLPLGMNAKILDLKNKYEGKQALWILCDITEIESADTILNDITEKLAQSLQPLEYPKLDYFILTKKWDKIVIIPTVNKKTLSNLAWAIPTYLFIDTQKIIIEETKLYQIPRPLEIDVIQQLNLEKQTIPYYADLIKLKELMVNINEMVMYMSCFVSILPNLDETGQHVLLSNFDKFNPLFKDSVLEAKKVIENLRNKLCSQSSVQHEDFIEILNICDNAILPYEEANQEHIEITINISDTVEWVKLLQQATSVLLAFQWLYVPTSTTKPNENIIESK